MKPETPLALPLIMLAMFAVMSATALAFPPQARLVPLLVGVCGTLLSFIQLVSSVHQMKSAPQIKIFSRPVVAIIAWIASFVAMILALGFSIGASVGLGFYLWMRNVTSPASAAIAALLCWSMFVLVFSWLLKLPLHDGFLFHFLAS